MKTEADTFHIEVESTAGVCPAGERYAEQMMREGRIPVLSCEGACIRGEIARQAANRVGGQPPFARACHGEGLTVPNSTIARWIREADQVLVLDGCFLRCHGRVMRRMLRPDQIVEIDVLPYYRKYNDLFAIDSVPEAERLAVAEQVAQRVLAEVGPRAGGSAAGSESGQGDAATMP